MRYPEIGAKHSGRLLTASVVVSGIALLILGLTGWTGLSNHIPVPPQVVVWLQSFFRFFGIFLVAIGLLANSIVHHQMAARIDAWLNAKHRAEWLLVCIVGAYIIGYAAFSSYRHYLFNSATYDLGIMDQTVWNTSQGRLFESSLVYAETGKNTFLAVHFQPLMALLAPLYWIQPSAYWLVITQSVFLGLGAIPLFSFARRDLQSPLAGIVLALAYCLYPPMGYVNRFDFHPEAMAIPLMLSAWYAIRCDKPKLASLCLFLTLLTKEEVGLTVAMIGLVTAISTKRVRFGLVWLVLGTAFSLMTLLAVVPTFRGGPAITLSRYAWLGSTPWQMLETVILRPMYVLNRIQEVGWFYMIGQILSPVALLPIASPLFMLLLLPGLAYNLLSGYAAQHTAYFQYIVPLVPVVFIASTYGILNLSRWLVKSLARSLPAWHSGDYRFFWLLVLTACALFAFWYDSPIRDHGVVPAAWIHLPNEQVVREALSRIPAGARVFTTNQYGAHLSHRRFLDVYYVRPDDLSRIKAADTVFLNLSDGRDATPERYQKLLAAAAQEGFVITFHKDDVVILQTDARSGNRLDPLLAR